MSGGVASRHVTHVTTESREQRNNTEKKFLWSKRKNLGVSLQLIHWNAKQETCLFTLSNFGCAVEDFELRKKDPIELTGVNTKARRKMASAEGNKIMVFRPTLAEFSNFPAYIHKMEEMGAHRAGVAKVNFIELV